MRIGVIGTGYVGLVQGIVLADCGHDVVCMDTDAKKIELLQSGKCPIYEPGLEELLRKCLTERRIQFTLSMKELLKQSKLVFIAVGTPENEDGSADLSHIKDAINEMALYLEHDQVIVNKSTVPVGTGRMIKKRLEDKLSELGKEIRISVVSNPEFLREGKALEDCSNPDRIVVGYDSEAARAQIDDVYREFINKGIQMVYTDIPTAEMIKYASNAFLATKISYINELALLCDKVDANICVVAEAMGKDKRISPYFLSAGAGYGGSCFPKDTKAIVKTANDLGIRLSIIEAAIDANESQKREMVHKIAEFLSNDQRLEGKTIGILGLSFKPDTDDMREAPAIEVINGLVGRGARIKAYCPGGMNQAKWRLDSLESHIQYMENAYEAAKETDALVIVTEWKEFLSLDYEKIAKCMKQPVLFDMRNIFWKDEEIKQIFTYFGVGVNKKGSD